MTFFFFFLCLKPKGKRFTTAKAPQNTTIDIEELMSPSEEEDEAEDEWRPEKPEKGRRVSKKPKATGVSSQTTIIGEQISPRHFKQPADRKI